MTTMMIPPTFPFPGGNFAWRDNGAGDLQLIEEVAKHPGSARIAATIPFKDMVGCLRAQLSAVIAIMKSAPASTRELGLIEQLHRDIGTLAIKRALGEEILPQDGSVNLIAQKIVNTGTIGATVAAQRPTVGRVVHYYRTIVHDADGPHPRRTRGGPYAAVITGVFDEYSPSSRVEIAVLYPGNLAKHYGWRTDVIADMAPEPTGECWSWPPRVP